MGDRPIGRMKPFDYVLIYRNGDNPRGAPRTTLARLIKRRRIWADQWNAIIIRASGSRTKTPRPVHESQIIRSWGAYAPSPKEIRQAKRDLKELLNP
jgi:hypothetical protein